MNRAMRKSLDDFFESGIFETKVDFISLQRENPNPEESTCVTPKDLTDAELLEVLRQTNESIWGTADAAPATH